MTAPLSHARLLLFVAMGGCANPPSTPSTPASLEPATVVTVLDARDDRPIQDAAVRFVGGCSMDALLDHATTRPDGRALFLRQPSISEIGPVGSCPPGGACATRESRCSVEVSAAGYIPFSGDLPVAIVRLGKGKIDSPQRAESAAMSDSRTVAWTLRFPGHTPRVELTNRGTWRISFGKRGMLDPFLEETVTPAGDVEVISCPSPRTPVTILNLTSTDVRLRDDISGITVACRQVYPPSARADQLVEVVGGPIASDACATKDGAVFEMDLGAWHGSSGEGRLHASGCARE